MALLLSFVCPGLGQLHAARPIRACAALAMACFVIMPVTALLPLALAWSAPVLIASYVLVVGLLCLVPVDAALCARRPVADDRSRPVRWIAFTGFAAVGMVLVNMVPGWFLPHFPLRLSSNPTGAMIPTLLIGDLVVVDRRTAEFSDPRPGDIIIFASPEDPSKEFVKRVAGLAGSTVEVRDGMLTVDGVHRAGEAAPAVVPGTFAEVVGGRTYRIRVTAPAGSGDCIDWGPQRVPEGTVFVLGDNRCNSRDSRSYGAIPLENLRGRARSVQWSLDSRDKQVRWDRIGVDLTVR